MEKFRVSVVVGKSFWIFHILIVSHYYAEDANESEISARKFEEIFRRSSLEWTELMDIALLYSLGSCDEILELSIVKREEESAH